MTTPAPSRVRLGRLLITGVATLLLNSCADARMPEAAATLRGLNAEYDRALVAADAAALDSLYHPEFIYLGSGGERRSRAQQLEAMSSGRVDVLDGRSDSVEVHVYGTTAIVLGRFTGHAQVGAERFAFRERYSTTWLFEARRWRLLVEHSTLLREPAA